MIRRFQAILFCLVFSPIYAWSQALRLEELDALFLKNNLEILAAGYSLTAAEAMEIQARAYPNPVFEAEFNLWDPQNKRLLHIGNTGQKAASFSQLIELGGKRATRMELARQNKEMARLEMEDLLRTLRQQLHSAFYNLHYQKATIRKFDQQLSLLDTIIQSYEAQVMKGNIPMKDLVRIKSVYLSIHNDRTDLQALAIQNQQQLKYLSGDSLEIFPVVDSSSISRLLRSRWSKEELVNTALQHRPDLKIAEILEKESALNEKWQRQLGIPDLNLGMGYDQLGGAFRNQVNLTLGMPLPLWDRNKGNRAAAKEMSKAASKKTQQSALQVKTEVVAALSNLELSLNDFRKVNQLYSRDFDEVFRGMNENFRKRNVSLIEFIDFFESYNQSVAEYQRSRTQVALAAEQLNFTTATILF